MKTLTPYQRKQAEITRAALKTFQEYCGTYGIAYDESILTFKLIHRVGVVGGHAGLSTKDIFGEDAA